MVDTTRVKCSVCSNEDGARCSVKKCKISINKRRTCDVFTFDAEKAQVVLKAKVKAETIPTTLRPDWHFNKNKRRAARREAIKNYERQMAKAEGLSEEKTQIDFTKPDCLANIRSTVSED